MLLTCMYISAFSVNISGSKYDDIPKPNNPNNPNWPITDQDGNHLAGATSIEMIQKLMEFYHRIPIPVNA